MPEVSQIPGLKAQQEFIRCPEQEQGHTKKTKQNNIESVNTLVDLLTSALFICANDCTKVYLPYV